MRIVILLITMFSTQLMLGQTPEELGTVNWLRSYETALSQSKESGKPIFILFQEVPGCATCRNYGQNVMSDPLLVDAIENEFIPLAIFNNKGGEDKRILNLYDEPTWNNPVVRIVDTQGEDLVRRIAGNYSIAGVVEGMKRALTAADQAIPEYINLIAAEQSVDRGTIYYSMYCFWSGEAAFGDQQGVLATEPGWMDGKEVVRIVYDPNDIVEKELDNIAAKNQCKPIKEKDDYRIDKDPQYYLKNSQFSRLALTEIQKTRINSMIYKYQDPETLLSPSQVTYLKIIQKNMKKYQSLYDSSFRTAWAKMKAAI